MRSWPQDLIWFGGQTPYIFGSTAKIHICADLICDAANESQPWRYHSDRYDHNRARLPTEDIRKNCEQGMSKKIPQPTPNILTSPASLSHPIIIANAPTSTPKQTHPPTSSSNNNNNNNARTPRPPCLRSLRQHQQREDVCPLPRQLVLRRRLPGSPLGGARAPLHADLGDVRRHRGVRVLASRRAGRRWRFRVVLVPA